MVRIMSPVNYHYRVDYGLPGKPPNMLLRIAGAVGSLLVLTLAAFLGFFVFLAVLGVVAVGGVVIAIRLAWLRRQWRRMEEAAEADRPAARGDYIDAEFTERDPR